MRGRRGGKQVGRKERRDGETTGGKEGRGEREREEKSKRMIGKYGK